MPVPTASLPLPPGPVGLPLVGSALHFIGPFSRSPHAVLTRLAKTHGPIMSFRPGMAGSFVVVSSPAAAREALVDNDAALAARFVPDVARALDHSSESLFFLRNSSSLWKQHRATVGVHMSSARSLDATRHIRERHARGLAERVRGRARSGAPVVVVRDAVLVTVLDVVSNVLFSEDVVGMRVQGGQLFKDLMVAVLEDWTKPNVSDAFPFLAPIDLFGSRRRVSRGLTKLYKFFDDEFIERRLANGENHGDLLDVVLARHSMSELTRSEITKFFTVSSIGVYKPPYMWSLTYVFRLCVVTNSSLHFYSKFTIYVGYLSCDEQHEQDHRGMGYGAAAQAPRQDEEGPR